LIREFISVKFTLRAIVLFALALVAGGRPAFAQAAQAGSGAADGRKPALTSATTLDVTLDVAEAYDSNLAAELGNVTPSAFQLSGAYTLFAPQAHFRTNGDRVQFAATAGSNARYFGESRDFVLTGYDAGVSVDASITKRTSISFGQGLTYAPSYLYGLFAKLAAPSVGDVVPAAANYAVDGVRSYASATRADISHNLTPRAAVVVTGSYNRTTLVGNNPGYSDVRSFDAGGRFTYSLNRDLTLRLGYTYRDGQYSSLLRTTEHDIDIGVDYSRPISPTRRTGVSFSVGPRVVNSLGSTLLSGAAIADRTPQSYGVVADVALNRQINRTWTARGAYHRGLVFIDGLQAPAYTDGVTAGMGGFLTRQTELSMGASLARGELAFAGTPSTFTTYTGDVRLQRAFGRTWAAYVEYLYYYYNFGRSIQLPISVTPNLTRNSIRGGFSLRLPVKGR
jgi:hypothetical protein